MLRLFQQYYSMESANHEFTWLPGRAHLSIGRESPGGGHRGCTREDSAQSDPGNSGGKPIASPSSANKLVEKSASSKPTPLPRIFRRSFSHDQSRSSSVPVYEVPPALDRSVFYVATPKDVRAVEAKCLSPPTPTVTTPIDKSIILEFDPILQPHEEEEANAESERLSALRLSTLKLSTPASETPTLPLTNEKCVYEDFETLDHVSQKNSDDKSSPFQTDDDNRVDSFNSTVDPSSIYDVPKKCALNRTVSNASSTVSTSSTKMSSTSSSSPVSTPSLDRARDTKRAEDEDHVICDSDKATPVPLAKCQSPISKPVPVPRTRIRLDPNTNKQYNRNYANCTLSTVPPPPSPSVVYKWEPTHEDPSNIPPNHATNSVIVENNLYMLCNNETVNSRLKVDDASVNRRSSLLEGGGYDPPPFPPPPLPPPDYNESVAVVTPVVTSTKEAVESAVIPRKNPSPNTRRAPPKPPRIHSTVNGQSSRTACHSSSKEPVNVSSINNEKKFKYHVYYNIQSLCGEPGVYGKINKSSRAESLPVDAPPKPPPLPPRGQNPRAPPSFKMVSQMLAAKRGTVALDGSTYISSDNPIPSGSKVSENLRNIPHHGMLYKIGKGRKDISQKWVVLERGHLQCYTDDKTDSPQDVFHKSDIVSVAKGADVKHSNLDLKCFEVVSISNRERSHVFGARYLSERAVWLKHLVQSLAPQSDGSINASGVTKAGYVFLRKSVTGSFQTCWLVLNTRHLYASYDEDKDSFSIDLRKVISMQEFEEDPQMSAMSDEGPVFVIHYPSLTIYIRSTVSFDTLNWYQRILQITKEVGNGLEEQQMTHEDVPVLVEKCIRFVGTYGLTSKGIYRESATNSKIAKLLDSFYKDAQRTDLKIEDHTEHEVANVLKRFFRSLPDPLLTKSLYPKWMAAVEDSSVENYRSLLEQLPKTNYQTLKKLMAHLRSVVEHSEHNLMHALNLAQVFGPTLLINEKDLDLSNANFEMEVMVHLIENYFTLFGVSNEEIEKEEMIQRALKDLRDAKTAQKPAGDILVGIYIYNRQKCINTKLSPTMTAYELCKYACQQIRIRERPENLAVFEVVCGGELERPLHYSEIVLSVTLRWATWAEADAKDNYLLIKSSDILHRVLPLTRQPLSTFGELKFASVKSKSFKKLLFEFKNARLAYYRDAKIAQPLEWWNIEDITWYIGAESKRPAQWCITFIENKAIVKRGSKDAPYFGRTICFAGEDEFNKWVASMFIGQYPNGILPKVEHYDLLT